MPPRRKTQKKAKPIVWPDNLGKVGKWCTPLAFTLTCPGRLHKQPMVAQFKAMKAVINSLDKVKISLVTELTEHDDVHFHGYISMQVPEVGSVQRHLRDYLRSNPKLGFTCIKPITDEPEWQVYLEKDRKRTEKEGLPWVACDDLHKFGLPDEDEDSPLVQSRAEATRIARIRAQKAVVELALIHLKRERQRLVEIRGFSDVVKKPPRAAGRPKDKGIVLEL